MSQMENFIFCADNLVEYFADIKEIPTGSLTLMSLQARKTELADLWLEVKSAYADCVRSKLEQLSEENLTAVKSKYKLSTETYISCLEFILTTSNKLNPSNSNSKSLDVQDNSASCDSQTKPPASQQNSSFENAFSLPACDSEVFHGDYLSWPSFRDMFSAVYINHDRLSPVQKLFHLRAKTRGDAFNLVSKFALTGTNFELAWKALSDQYENKRILVNSQLKILMNLPNITVETDKALKHLHRDVSNCLSALKTYGINTDSWDSFLTFLVSIRLPEKTLSLWEQDLKEPTEVPTWKNMSEFLAARYKMLETVTDIRLSAKPNVPHTKVTRMVNTHHVKSNKHSCVICQGNHSLRTCPSFLQMSVQNRSETVRNHNSCSNCLASYHTLQACKSQFTCNHCKKRHHTLLHIQNVLHSQLPMPSSSTYSRSKSSMDPQPQIQSITKSTSTDVSSYFSTSTKQILLATALVSIHIQGFKYTLRALIDPGSEVTLISKAAQVRLGLPFTPIHAQISGVNTALATTSKLLCHFTLGSEVNPQVEISAQALVVENPTGKLPSQSVASLDLTKLSGLRLSDPHFYKSSRVDLLIGADLYPDIILEGLHHNVFGRLIAQNTIFGWIISGPLPNVHNSAFTTLVTYFNKISLDDEIKRFWELEEITAPRPLSSEDRYCESFYSESTYRDTDGRYVVKLTFKPEFPESEKLGLSRNICEKRFLNSERRLKKNPSLESEYNNVISEYLDVDHMQRVASKELIQDRQIMSYYLPHHAVVKPESSTTKLRVVFNASNPSENGNSLNDVLYTGPVLQQDLVSLMLRWRMHKYVFNADIAKMYRQIRIHPTHTPFQRILFRTSPDKPIEDFELKTVTFGVNCAPYLAIRTLLQLADDEESKYSLGSRMLRNDFYVDDLLSGSHSLNQALKLQAEIISILDSASGHPIIKLCCRIFLRSISLMTNFLI